MEVEAVLLTGGGSRRMGSDKSKLLVEGEPLGARIARLLSDSGLPVTVLGREPIDGAGFRRDRELHAGPLAALAGFNATADLVFVVSCDLPGFDPAIVSILCREIGGHDAAVPVADGREQPLCALYTRSALDAATRLVASGEQRVMKWLRSLNWVAVHEADPKWIRNVNTPEDFAQA